MALFDSRFDAHASRNAYPVTPLSGHRITIDSPGTPASSSACADATPRAPATTPHRPTSPPSAPAPEACPADTEGPSPATPPAGSPPAERAPRPPQSSFDSRLIPLLHRHRHQLLPRHPLPDRRPNRYNRPILDLPFQLPEREPEQIGHRKEREVATGREEDVKSSDSLPGGEPGREHRSRLIFSSRFSFPGRLGHLRGLNGDGGMCECAHKFVKRPISAEPPLVRDSVCLVPMLNQLVVSTKPAAGVERTPVRGSLRLRSNEEAIAIVIPLCTHEESISARRSRTHHFLW